MATNIKFKKSNLNNEMTGKIECPRCGSLDTVASNPLGTLSAFCFTLSFASFVALGCSFWIPIVGWALIPVFGFGIALGLAGTLLFGILAGTIVKNYNFTCKSCHDVTKVDKKEYLREARSRMDNK